MHDLPLVQSLARFRDQEYTKTVLMEVARVRFLSLPHTTVFSTTIWGYPKYAPFTLPFLSAALSVLHLGLLLKCSLDF